MINNTIILDSIITGVYVGCLVLEHFQLLPAGAENVVVALWLGKAIGTASSMVKPAGGGPDPRKIDVSVKGKTPDHG